MLMRVGALSDSKEQTGEFLLMGQGIARIGGQTYDQIVQSAIREAILRMGPTPSLNTAGALQAMPSEVEGLTLGALDQILVATRNLLVEHSLDAVTIERVIETANLLPDEITTLKQHFPTPEALCIKLFERFNSPLMEALSSAAIGSTSVIDSLEHIGRQWFILARRDIPLYKTYIDLVRRPSGELAPMLAEALMRESRKKQTIFAGLLAEGQMRGEVREGSVDVMLTAMIGCFEGLLMTLSHSDQLVEAGIYADDVINEVLRLIIDGLRRNKH